MNAYLVSNEEGSDIVFAETRGKAKSYFIGIWDGEWTDHYLIRLIKRNIDKKPGYAATDDPLWNPETWIIPAEMDEDGRIWL